MRKPKTMADTIMRMVAEASCEGPMSERGHALRDAARAAIEQMEDALRPFADEGRKAREIHVYPHPERIRAIGDCTYADLYLAADVLPALPAERTPK